VKPLVLTAFTASSCLGRGLGALRASLEAARSGLAPCAFETVTLATCVGEVPGVGERLLPEELREF
jgi:3-oxoacyl-[acyl-carrier-protein] synthase-1